MEQKRITLRIPLDLYDKIEASAKTSSRSITGEIIECLNELYSNDPVVTKSQVQKLIKDELKKALSK